MEIQADLSVCTFTKRPGPTLHRLLSSVYQTSDPVSLEVIVVDQSPKDETTIISDFPEVIVYQSQEIENFSTTHNRAMALTTGRYIALIEEDVVIPSGYFTNTLTFLDNNPDVGIAGPKVLNAYGKPEPSCRNFHSFFSLLASYTPFGQLPIGRMLQEQHLLKGLSPDDIAEVDWICSGSHIIRREVFEEIGLLDETLEPPFSEQDYYLRARQMGWHDIYCPKGEIIHGKPTKYHLDLQESSSLWEIFRNGSRYFRKKWFHSRRNAG